MVKKGDSIKTAIIIIVVIVIILLILSFTSTGFSNFLKKLTGQAISQTPGVQVQVQTVAAPRVIYVSTIPATSPTENGYTSITFSALVNDSDGLANINYNSIRANITRIGIAGEEVRVNNSCTNTNNLTDGRTANFSCTINMWYWDTNAVWYVTIHAEDINVNKNQNRTTSFTYQSLQAIMGSPSLITFPLSNPGDANLQSSNHPSIINNTGNYENSIAVTGRALTFSTDNIPAANFAAGSASGTVCASGNSLVESTPVTLTGVTLNNGNVSAGQGQASVYYCLKQVPIGIGAGTYNTVTPWSIAQV